MEKQVINAGLLGTGGPINLAVKHGNMIYISGLPPFTPEFTQSMIDARKNGQPLPKFPDMPFEQQVRIVMNNMKKLMEAAGSNMDCLLKVIVWLRDQSQSEIFDRIYREYFTSPATWPARTRMQAGRTPLDMGLEVDAVGYIPQAPKRKTAAKRASAKRGAARNTVRASRKRPTKPR
ncbi:MAG: RidA family protein [Betaproteobacteria bacterium]|nr:RidA family protein [Betaproteobacteria bacterium]